MSDQDKPGTFAVPGPRLVGFRYGILSGVGIAAGRPPGRLLSLNMGFTPAVDRDDEDLLVGHEPAVCKRSHYDPNLAARGPVHEAPTRGCECGYHAFSTVGNLIGPTSNYEWGKAEYAPAVALHWGRTIPAELGFRTANQVIIAVARPLGIYPGTWERWARSFLERKLPVALVEESNAYDSLVRLYEIGRQYGIMIGDVPKSYRVAPSPKWEPPAPTPPPIPVVAPPPPMAFGASRFRPAVTPQPSVPKRTKRIASTGFCQCGCGAKTRAMFKPGHDAKHKGNLKRAARRGDQAAIDELNERGW